MDVNFELYKVFYHVASNLSFSEASSQLYISQSAVSQAVRQLEKKLQCQLFNRHTKKVTLTPEGELLYKHIEQAFNFIKTGERSIREVQSLEQGTVRIGASDTICKYYLLPYFKKFNELYPNIKIHVTNRPSPVCIDLLQQGVVDLAVINSDPASAFNNLTFKEWRAIEDGFITGKNFPALQNRLVSLAELASYPLLLLEKNTLTREFFDTWTKSQGVALTPEIELSSVDLLVDLARIGLGIAFVNKDTVSGDDLFVINIKEKIPKRSLGILTHNNLPLPLAAKKFIEVLD